MNNTNTNRKPTKFVGYACLGTSYLCGAIVGVQFIIQEWNWNMNPTREYVVGTPSGVIDLFHRAIEWCLLLVSPTVLPFVIVGAILYWVGLYFYSKSLT